MRYPESMGRGTGHRDRFSDVFGTRRGISMEDTILSKYPTDRARAEFRELLAPTGPRSGQEMSDVDFGRLSALVQANRTLVHERPLLHALAIHLTHQAAADMMRGKRDFHLALLGALTIMDEGRADFADVITSHRQSLLESVLESESPFGESLRAGAEEMHQAFLPSACARAIRVEGLGGVLVGVLGDVDAAAHSSRMGTSFEAVARSFEGSEDYLALSRSVIGSLGDEMPTDSKVVRNLIAGPIIQAAEAHYRTRVTERRTQDAERSREASALLRAESARVSEIMDAMPNGTDPAKVLRTLSSGLADVSSSSQPSAVVL